MTGCKFNVGDWVKFVERGRPYKILEINRDFPSQQISYLLMELSGNSSYYNKNYVDNSCHLWSLKDARLGDILYLDDNNIVVFKNLYNSTTFHSVCFIEDGVFSVREDWWNGEGFCPLRSLAYAYEMILILFRFLRATGNRHSAPVRRSETPQQKRPDRPHSQQPGDDQGSDPFLSADK